MEAARGSTEAFTEIVDRYQGKVLNLIARWVGDREAARDLTQECFLKLLRNARSYRVRARFSTFLFTIARRLAGDHVAKAWERREPLPDSLPAAEGNPARDLERKELRHRLDAVLATLAEEDREVFLLSELAGLRYGEIAEIVGCPAGTVGSRKHRAVRQLRESWKGERA